MSKDSISTVISRRTLQKGVECSANLFDKVTLDRSTHWNKTLQGFTIYGDSSTITMEQAKELVEGLDDVHINLERSDRYEICFVKAHIETLNAWYKMMREGLIAQKILSKYGMTAHADGVADTQEYKDYEYMLRTTLPKHWKRSSNPELIQEMF